MNGNMAIMTSELDRSKYNVIGPDMVAQVTPYHKRIATQVVLSANPSDGDVYALQGDISKLAPTKLALLKLADAAGVRWQYAQCKKTAPSVCEFCKAAGDNCLKCSHHGTIAYQAVGAYQDGAGQWRPIIGTAEVDPSERDRVGKNDGKTEGQRMKAYLLRHVESRAFNAAIRTLGVKQWYTPVEIKKPFVVVRTYFDGYSDPDFKRLMLARAAADMAELYGEPDPHPQLTMQARQVLQLAEGDPKAALESVDVQTGEILEGQAEESAPQQAPAQGDDIGDLVPEGAIIEPAPAPEPVKPRSRGDLMNELQTLAMDYYPSAPGIALNNHLKRECGGPIGVITVEQLLEQIGVFKQRLAEKKVAQ